MLWILFSIGIDNKLSLHSFAESVFMGGMFAIIGLLRRKKGMLPSTY